MLGSLVEAARAGGGLGGSLAELTRNWRFERHPGIGNLARAVLNRDPEAALAAVVALRLMADRLEAAAGAAALEQGWSWAQIAQALGVSKQAAHKRLSPHMPQAPQRPRS